MPTIRIGDETYSRLQVLAVPFTDTPSTVIDRLLDYWNQGQTHGERVVRDEPRTMLTPELLELVRSGILEDGESLIWRRPQKGVTHRAHIRADGIHLEDGSTHSTPSSAAKHLAGGEVNGWRVWRTERGDLPLASYTSRADAVASPDQEIARDGEFRLTAGAAKATARRGDGNSMVLTSFLGPLPVHESMSERNRARRHAALRSERFVEVEPGIFELVGELELPSPSAASTIILGHESNGRELWKDRAGLPLGDR
ncbi:DUF4357 domain-containing protein [Agromyces intestinalis]|uniref:DUF4357 domain-containing protein n=1 Tax=Agromyces intestinalis TaxID=2592652 RepID=A0A5C1YHR8_9MICO|nr:DUF4357 domain-containing protein [Agromyces intestinalis]QEO14960.1 DUF4357 domain-containing protein [Agromyces intestinalis]